jgi:phage head maturation protease
MASANSSKRIYAEISKTEQQDDGTIKVWGWASTATVDSDGETITADAMKAALPDYMKFGAVREMHQPKAAGTAIEAEVKDDGRTWFGAHVVDSEAVKKVTTNVYKGFSIGGKVTERDELNKSVIKGLKLVEVSLVDRPANPEAVFTMYKAESTPQEAVDELARMLDAGTISPASSSKWRKPRRTGAETTPAPVVTPETDRNGQKGHVRRRGTGAHAFQRHVADGTR